MILTLPVTLANRYRATRRLGAGACAETYLAEDLSTNRHVAIKLLRPEYASDPDSLRRFEQEALSSEAIDHSNVVQVHDHVLSGETPFLVMEYVPGVNLNEFIQARGVLKPDEAIGITRQILAGLSAIHKSGVVHQDIKPENVLMTPSGQAIVCDFSIARSERDESPSNTGMARGTAAYMAPEQATGSGTGPATDVYATGVILFELLTGRLPFSGKDPLEVLYQQVHCSPPSLREYVADIPEWVESITLRALEKSPNNRFACAATMAMALVQSAGPLRNTRPLGLVTAGGVTAATAAMPCLNGALDIGTHTLQVAGPESRGIAWSRLAHTPAITVAILIAVLLAIGGALAIDGDGGSSESHLATAGERPPDVGPPAVATNPQSTGNPLSGEPLVLNSRTDDPATGIYSESAIDPRDPRATDGAEPSGARLVADWSEPDTDDSAGAELAGSFLRGGIPLDHVIETGENRSNANVSGDSSSSNRYPARIAPQELQRHERARTMEQRDQSAY